MTTRLSATARHRLGQWIERSAAENAAEPRAPNVMAGRYDGAELRPDPSILPSRMVAHHLPSRVGNRLYWPNGRVTDLDHIEVTE